MSYVVLWALVVVLSAIVVALARQVGTLHLRLGPRGALEVDEEGPPLGEAPEPVSVAAADGTELRIGGPGQPQLLMFVSAGCPVCDQVLPAVAAIAGDDGIAPFVLVEGDAAAAALVVEARRVAAPVAAAPELARRYDVPGTPYVVVLDDVGVVRAKGTVNNLEQVEGLARTAGRRLGRPLAGGALA